MSHNPHLAQDQEALGRMIRDAGSPEAAAGSLLDRIQALEEAVTALEQSVAASVSQPDVTEVEAAPAPGE
jgi:hypothetical protein